MDLQVASGKEEAVRALAAAMSEHLAPRPGLLRVAVPGGSTPRLLYRLLVQDPYLGELPWSRITWVLSDERCVPPSDPESNFGMVREALAPAAPRRIVAFRGDLPPEEAVAEANAELGPWFTSDPALDLVLLGLGEDGHTASLFPADREPNLGTFPVAQVFQEGKGHRLTLVPRALSSTAALWFLTVGAAKARAVAETLSAGKASPRYPATLLPLNRSRWFLDREAAARLGRGDS